MAKILIIADDLTGAADCGAAFAECGMETTVLLTSAGSGAMNVREVVDTQALAIDADTRCLGPEQAAACVSGMVRTYGDGGGDRGPNFIFKKIDSTLRGNVAAELAATLAATREHASTRVVILLAPAFPACGRTTVNGRQFLYGKPVKNFDPWRRHCQSDIATGVEQVGLTCKLLELVQVRAGVSGLTSAMRIAASESDVLI